MNQILGFNMNNYDKIKSDLIASPRHWLITGVAGFIGSNLLEALLNLNQKVVGLDNFSTGSMENLIDVKENVGEKKWLNFKLINGDIRSIDDCNRALTYQDGMHKQSMRNNCPPIDYVLHQAALGSVPRSVVNPIDTNDNNINGFLNMLVSSRDAHVKKFVYASSSSVYGDNPDLPKIEDKVGKQLSPYAITKFVNELYAGIFSSTYNFKSVGLRYFNVFGSRQSPYGEYSAVIPRWILRILKGEIITINGDGDTSRDFCYVDNVVQANILAAITDRENSTSPIYNVAVGDSTTLVQLIELIENCIKKTIANVTVNINYSEFRMGDIRHSLASIEKAKKEIGYFPTHKISDGISNTVCWYVNKYLMNK